MLVCVCVCVEGGVPGEVLSTQRHIPMKGEVRGATSFSSGLGQDAPAAENFDPSSPHVITTQPSYETITAKLCPCYGTLYWLFFFFFPPAEKNNK